MADEPGREVGVRLESRDVDMLLDNLRSQDRGWLAGVPAEEVLSSSLCTARGMPLLDLARGVRLLFCPILELLGRERA